jgi:hypothetical protein
LRVRSGSFIRADNSHRAHPQFDDAERMLDRLAVGAWILATCRLFFSVAISPIMRIGFGKPRRHLVRSAEIADFTLKKNAETLSRLFTAASPRRATRTNAAGF